MQHFWILWYFIRLWMKYRSSKMPKNSIVKCISIRVHKKIMIMLRFFTMFISILEKNILSHWISILMENSFKISKTSTWIYCSQNGNVGGPLYQYGNMRWIFRCSKNYILDVAICHYMFSYKIFSIISEQTNMYASRERNDQFSMWKLTK